MALSKPMTPRHFSRANGQARPFSGRWVDASREVHNVTPALSQNGENPIIYLMVINGD